MAEYSRLASGQVVSTGGSTNVILPFVPDFIEITNTNQITAASGGVSRAWWEKDFGQGAAAYVTTGSGPADGSNFVSASTGGGFSTVQAGLSLQYGPTVLLGGSGGITAASPAVVTTTAAHGLVSGNVVVFSNLYETSTTGMNQMAGVPLVVTVTGTTTFSVNWNASGGNYTAISAGGLNTNASFKKVLYPSLYAPGDTVITAITRGATTVVTTAAPHNFVVGQEVAFRIPSVWGTTQLNSLPDVVVPGSPIYGFVTVVNSSVQVTVNINSTGYTAFNPNQPFASVPGLKLPQMVAVGDANSGSLLSGYASPSVYNGTGTGAVSTINGPAIAGAYINATYQGFIIGATVSGSSADVLYWRAYAHDISY